MTERTEAKARAIDDGIVASVWRDGYNIGMNFSRRGHILAWDDMNEGERIRAVQNLKAAADFFAECVLQGRSPAQKKGVEGAV